jgi:hypothetical protein
VNGDWIVFVEGALWNLHTMRIVVVPIANKGGVATDSWMHDRMVNGNLPSVSFTLEREEDRSTLHRVIEGNKDHLQILKFWGKEPYKWKYKFVYQKLRKHLKYKR